MVEVISLLDRLVSYDTRTWKDTPAKESLDLYKEELIPLLKANNFRTEIVESNGHYSLFAEKSGTKPSILYSGHVDVVPWDQRWETDPRSLILDEEDGKTVVRGRGVSDMKSGIAAMFSAIDEIAQSENHIMFAITGDEEIAGENGTGVIVEKLAEDGNLPDFVITADAAGMEIITRRRNVFNVKIKMKESPRKITGKRLQKAYTTEINSSNTSHAAYFVKSVDEHCVKMAAEDMIKNGYEPINISGDFVSTNVIPNQVIVDFVDPDGSEEIMVDDSLKKLLHFCDKVMRIDFETEAFSDYGINSTVNQIIKKGEYWELVVDIRAMLSHESTVLDDAIQEIASELGGNFEIDIFKSIGYIATEDESILVKGTTSVLEDLGYPGNTAERGGATDGRFFAKYSIPTIDIGAIGFRVHGPNETATVKSIKDLSEFFKQCNSRIVTEYQKEKT